MNSAIRTYAAAALFAATALATVASGQGQAPPATAPAPAPAPAASTPTKQPSAAGPIGVKPAPSVAPPAGVAVPADYVIGPDDILIIVFWREKDLSSEALVRPDGRISIPVLQDIEAAGLTPEQLRVKLTEQAEKYVEDPNVTVVVKQINSRRVYITGMVSKPGPYMLTMPMTVVQLISMAGGLLEYADSKNIVIMRNEGANPTSYRFNYREVAERKNLKQNIMLKPGDTIIVP